MSIPAAVFKAECLKLMDEVARTGQPVVITKHGKPYVKLVKFDKPELIFGLLEGSYPQWEKLEPSEPWLSEEALGYWRKKTSEPQR